MKIIQIIANISGGGMTKYICELNKSLQLVGADIKIWRFLIDKEFNSDMIDSENIIIEDKTFDEDTINELNSCDYVFVNGMPLKKHPEDFKNNYINMIKNLKSKTVLFNNAHHWRSIIANYGKVFLDKELMMSFYKIAAFSKGNEFFAKMIELYGDEIEKKYVHLQLPYEFDSSKSLWKKFEDKYPRATYFGRPGGWKDPGRIIAMQPELIKNGFEGEMRGILRSISITSIPNLVYHFDENGNATSEKSRITQFITNKWKTEHGFDINDSLITYTDRHNKVFIFGPYQNAEGMEAISYSMFACDFYHLKNHQYGDTLEYALYDIINVGSIPMCDYGMGQHLYANENGLPTNKTLVDLNCGIFVNDDLSNISDVICEMKQCTKNAENYDKLRNYIFEIYKKHADPKGIATQLLTELNS